MKLIYTGRTTTDAHLFAALLADQGITAELRGEPMWVSEEPRLSPRLPVTTVWVSEGDAERGVELANEHALRVANSDATDWSCVCCGEANPAPFDECWNCGAVPGTTPAVDSSLTEKPADRLPDVQIASVSGEGVTPEGSEQEPSREVLPERVPKAEEPGEPWTRLPVPWTFPWGLTLVTTICVLVWHGLSSEPNPLADPAMEHWGWRSAHDVWGGAWWSLLTSSFVHAEWDHLEGNILWLWVFGLRLEQALGTGRFLVFLVASAILSGAVDQAWLGEHSFGASGMLSAVYGLFVVAGTTYRLMPMWYYIPLCLYFAEGTLYDIADIVQEMAGQEVADPVANVCHLTGLAFGALTGLAFIERWKPRICALGFGTMTVLAVLPLMWAPWSYDWCLDRAKLAKDHQESEDALAWYDRAIQLKPDDARGWIDRAELHLQANRFTQALADANTAVSIEEALIHSAATANERHDDEGVATAETSRGDEARQPTEKPADKSADSTVDRPHKKTIEKTAAPGAEDAPPPDPSPEPGTHPSKVTGLSFLTRGRVFHAMGQYADAEGDLTRAILISNDGAFAHIKRAMVRWDLSRHSDALDDLSAALTIAPNDATALRIRGGILVDRAEPLAGRDDLERVVASLRQPGKDHLLKYEELVELATASDDLESPGAAETYATQALGHVPHDWDMLARRAHVRMQLGKNADALVDAEAALEANPRFVFAHCVRGLVLLDLERVDEAEKAFQRAVEINPRCVMALRGRAATRFERGRKNAALEDLNRAVQLNPRCAPAYLERSNVHASLGNTHEAETDRRIGEALESGLPME
ncbi:MAG: rhomboid family intramembrane serine protease [Planctomycetaceae bacterium]|nr:rhomboid family intramembrane serine protease [Planctomycetaceae bacterium]